MIEAYNKLRKFIYDQLFQEELSQEEIEKILDSIFEENNNDG